MKYDQLEASLFISNRRRFREQMEPNSIAVFHSNDIMPTSADGTMPFIQQTDLFYLSGVDQEETILVIVKDPFEHKYEEVLFVRETNDQIMIWEGKKLTKEEAKAVSGIQTIYWTHEFEKEFRRMVVFAQNIYLNTNEHLRATVEVETRDDRFRKWCMSKYPLHQYKRASPILYDLRALKSTEEIRAIQQACKIAEKAFRRVLSFVKPDVYEYEIEAEILHELIRNRSRRPAFSMIIASGSNSCVLHYVDNEHQCKDGDLLLMDFGAEYGNYVSDISRTIPVNGRYTKRQKEVYNAVLRVHNEAMQLLRPGNTLDEYHKQVGKIMERELIGLGLLDAIEVINQDLDKPLYKKYFMHGASHHLGLDVHDTAHWYHRFEPGMIFTCEPGIYIPEENIGVRIENDIIVTNDDPYNLMENIPMEAEEIEELMNA